MIRARESASSVTTAKGYHRARGHQSRGKVPVILRRKPWRRWNMALPGRNMNGHSPGITEMPFDSQYLTASGETEPLPAARNIQTRLTPAAAQSRTTDSVTTGDVMMRAPSTGG